jgi:uncharacterized Tic20 family protein
MGMKPDTYCMLLHLSQLLNVCVPSCGIIVPIVLWALGKDKSAQIDQHGKIVMNWQISLFIYTILFFVVVTAITFLSFFASLSVFGDPVVLPIVILFLTTPISLLLWAIAITFSIIGAVKANGGIAWKYPLSITFFRQQ